MGLLLLRQLWLVFAAAEARTLPLEGIARPSRFPGNHSRPLTLDRDRRVGCAQPVLGVAVIRWQGSIFEFFAFYKNYGLLACFAGPWTRLCALTK